MFDRYLLIWFKRNGVLFSGYVELVVVEDSVVVDVDSVVVPGKLSSESVDKKSAWFK